MLIVLSKDITNYWITLKEIETMPDYVVSVLQFIGGWGFLLIVIILMDRWFKN